ncbi:MAG: hypothetical protein H0X25_15285 [Acidobacteriales bacterium]|nr:hypothetical protein [Terriglobales bacterium]
MSWIEKHFQNVSSEAPVAQAEAHFESREQDTWQQLCKGLEQDVSDFNQHGGKASLQESGIRVAASPAPKLKLHWC